MKQDTSWLADTQTNSYYELLCSIADYVQLVCLSASFVLSHLPLFLSDAHCLAADSVDGTWFRREEGVLEAETAARCSLLLLLIESCACSCLRLLRCLLTAAYLHSLVKSSQVRN